MMCVCVFVCVNFYDLLYLSTFILSNLFIIKEPHFSFLMLEFMIVLIF